MAEDVSEYGIAREFLKYGIALISEYKFEIFCNCPKNSTQMERFLNSIRLMTYIGRLQVVMDFLLHGQKRTAYKGDYDTFERTRDEQIRNQQKALETSEKARAHMQVSIFLSQVHDWRPNSFYIYAIPCFLICNKNLILFKA